jgi:glutamyl-tRNA(Gln) amidotransferase subunit E
MVNANPADEIHVMRKTVIDGSNTTGFQRTSVIALNGNIEAENKKIPIQLIALEEDAARKMGDEDSGKTIRYRIDRLGIPLIEVTTGPVLYSPQEAEKTALAIGRILRATGKVKRGLGTIRQDLNIDIKDGALVEIKGVQELELVSKAVEYEAQRQINLIKIQQELKQRNAKESTLKEEFVVASEIFRKTQCKVIKNALEDRKQVLAVRLPHFAGLLKIELMPNMRLGTEMADRARFWGRVGGIFHTDEMPAYGVTAQEIDQLKKLMNAEENDALVFVADNSENSTDALKAVVERAKDAFKGVPEETRAANPDGTTRYMRPRPGAARMYPETDVPSIQVTQDRLKQLIAHLPEMPERKMERLTENYGLNQKLAKQVLDSEYASLFEVIVKETKVSPTVVAAILTETMKSLKREGTPTENISDQQIRQLFELIGKGQTVKEAAPDIITWLAKHEGASADQAVQDLGLGLISQHEIEEIIDTTVKENKALVEKSGEAAFGALMGQVMKKLRGKADAETVVTTLKRRLRKN